MAYLAIYGAQYQNVFEESDVNLISYKPEAWSSMINKNAGLVGEMPKNRVFLQPR
jgi:hypothetical protein